MPFRSMRQRRSRSGPDGQISPCGSNSSDVGGAENFCHFESRNVSYCSHLQRFVLRSLVQRDMSLKGGSLVQREMSRELAEWADRPIARRLSPHRVGQRRPAPERETGHGARTCRVTAERAGDLSATRPRAIPLPTPPATRPNAPTMEGEAEGEVRRRAHPRPLVLIHRRRAGGRRGPRAARRRGPARSAARTPRAAAAGGPSARPPWRRG